MGKKGKGKGKKVVDLTAPGSIPSSVSEGFTKAAVALGMPDPDLTKSHAALLLELLEPKEPAPYETRLVWDNVRLGPGYARCLVASLLGHGPGFGALGPSSGGGGKSDKKKDGAAEVEVLPPVGEMPSGAPLPPVSAQYQPLEELLMIESELGDAGGAALAALVGPLAVARGVALQHVTVRGDKHFGKAAAEAWAVALAWSRVGATLVSPLLKLSLDYCPALDDQGVSNLCSGLLYNGTLQELSLAYCGFSAEAVYALSNLIAHPRKLAGSQPPSALTTVRLRGNYLGARGLSALAPGIATSRCLSHLDLSACGVGRPIFVKSAAAADERQKEFLEAWRAFAWALGENVYGNGIWAYAPALFEGEGDDLSSHNNDAASLNSSSGNGDGAVVHAEDTDSAAASPPPNAFAGTVAVPEGPRTRLAKLNLLENNLTAEQAEVLHGRLAELDPKGWPSAKWDLKGDPKPCWVAVSPSGPPPPGLEFLSVDVTLPDEWFVALWRGGGGGGKKGGKKGKKKK